MALVVVASSLPFSPPIPKPIISSTQTTTQSQTNSNGFSSVDLDQRVSAKGALLQSPSKQGDIEMSSSLILSARAITKYSQRGCPSESRLVFDETRNRNLCVWNAMLSGYIRNDLYYDAVLLFVDFMAYSDYEPDNFTFPCVIKACAGLLEVVSGKCLHGLCIKFGLTSDVFVGNSLIAMYGRFGFMEEAVAVFEQMSERNVVTWNSILCGFSQNGFFRECFEVFNEMLRNEEVVPDVATLVTLLPICAKEREVEMGMVVHGLAVRLALNDELKVSNALIDMYSKCGFLYEADILFDKKNGSNTNLVSWNSIIGAYSRLGDGEGTFNLLQEMQLSKIKLNEVTILNVLPVFMDKSKLLRLKELHCYAIRNGLICDEVVANSFISTYTKCAALDYADRVLSIMEKKTVSSWNALISGYAQNGDFSNALDVYHRMTYTGQKPDSFSISSLLLSLAHQKSLDFGKQVHGFVFRNGLENDSFITVSLISMYIRCKELSSAQVLFDKMEIKNVVAWNAMIAGYSQNELPNEALNLLRQMVLNRVKPSEIALMSGLCACSQLSFLQLGKEIHCFAIKEQLAEDIYVHCSIIDMYAKSGSTELSRKIFDHVKDKDVASWSVIISGYGINGNGTEAIKLFEKMKILGFQPDEFTYIGVLTACNHAGLVEEGLEYFNQMEKLHKLKQKMEHYACVVDMLGRAGRFKDAMQIVNNMTEKPDIGIWSSLLSSCRVYDDIDLAKMCAENLLKLGPNKAENYVLVSNVFAKSGDWDNVRMVRRKMKQLGLHKEASYSWIELGGKVNKFVVGDKMHPEYEEIETMWRRLEKKIIEIGHVHDTSVVLHELKEEEKVDILRGHSEKLALTYGVLKAKKGARIRICKNLRICRDCHNAIKLVSKIIDREIIVRDNKRFHHFNNGLCSCGDYW